MKKMNRRSFGTFVLAVLLVICMMTMFACGGTGEDTTTPGDDPVVETKYSVTVANDITNGSVSSSHASTIAGTVITLTATPNSGYELSSISYNETAITADSDGAYTFTMPSENVEVKAEFAKLTYDISIDSAIENGTITAATSSAWGETVIVTVTSDSGYGLTANSLKYNDSTSIMAFSGVYQFTMPQYDVTITGDFTKDSFTATVTNGTFADGTTYGSYSSGDKVTLTANVADTGKEFVGWYEAEADGTQTLISESTVLEYTLTEAINFVAVYNDIYYVATVTGGTTDKESYTYGETATIMPTVESGYQFMYWEDEDGNKYAGSSESGQTGWLSVTMTENVAYTAVFDVLYATDMYYVDAFGLLGTGDYFVGQTVDIIMESDRLQDGEYADYEVNGVTYSVNGITVDGVDIELAEGERYTFIMPAYDVTITPTFASTMEQITIPDSYNWDNIGNSAFDYYNDTQFELLRFSAGSIYNVDNFNADGYDYVRYYIYASADVEPTIENAIGYFDFFYYYHSSDYEITMLSSDGTKTVSLTSGGAKDPTNFYSNNNNATNIYNVIAASVAAGGTTYSANNSYYFAIQLCSATGEYAASEISSMNTVAFVENTALR